MAANSLKDARAALLADTTLAGCGVRPRAGGSCSTRRSPRCSTDAAAGNLRVALVALGSYERRELCPGSDVDVLLLHDVRGRQRDVVKDLAERCWYPLWDAGFVTGHGTPHGQGVASRSPTTTSTR